MKSHQARLQRLLSLVSTTPWAWAVFLCTGSLPLHATTWQELAVAPSPLSLPPIQTVNFEQTSEFELTPFHEIAAKLIGKTPTKESIEAVRFAISEWLYKKHYFTSGAVIAEDEDVSDGEITFKLIGGEVSEVKATLVVPDPETKPYFDVGRPLVSPSFYESRLSKQIETPINRTNLTQILNNWPQIYPIEEVRMSVLPGTRRGEAKVNVDIKEKERFNAGLGVDNHRAPSSGAEQATLFLHSESLTRHRDTLDFDYGLVRNLDGQADWLGSDQFGIRYELPIRVDDTRTAAYFRRSTSLLIEEPFDHLDIESRFQLAGWSLTHPLVQTSSRQWSVTLAAEHKQLETTLGGQPVDLSEGFENGEASVTAVRLSTTYLVRSTRSVLGVRAAASAGLDALGASTQHERDGQFVTLLSEIQYVREFGTNGPPSQLITKATAQYSPDPLLTIEQMPVGGANSVRGYRENSLVRDSAVHGTLEYRLPLFPGLPKHNIRFAVFGDVGYGTNNGAIEDRIEFISSLGGGLLATPYKNSEFSLYVGVPLRDISNPEKDLQDYGIHFKFTTWAF